jgi:hypothetical protein
MSHSLKALETFRTKYPLTTSADMQTFVLGYKAGFQGKEYIRAKLAKIKLCLNLLQNNITPEEEKNILSLISTKVNEINDIVELDGIQ